MSIWAWELRRHRIQGPHRLWIANWKEVVSGGINCMTLSWWPCHKIVSVTSGGIRWYQLQKPESGAPVLVRLLLHTPVISCTRFLVLQSVRDLTTPFFASPFHCFSGPSCVQRTCASADSKSTASVFTALTVANPPDGTFDLIKGASVASRHPWLFGVKVASLAHTDSQSFQWRFRYYIIRKVFTDRDTNNTPRKLKVLMRTFIDIWSWRCGGPDMYTLRNLLWSVFRKNRHHVGISKKLMGFSKNRPSFGFSKYRLLFFFFFRETDDWSF